MSAWVSDAIRHKALARAELAADLDELQAQAPPDADALARVAETVDGTQLGSLSGWV